MKRIAKIIEDNHDIPFVVFTKNKEEFDDLLEVLIEKGYEPAIPLDSLENMMKFMAKSCGYRCGWRISMKKGIAWNESLEHWKQYYNDILKIDENDEIVFV